MTDLSRVRVTGPLEPFATGFAVELVRQGYASQPAAQQLRLLAHLSRWLMAEGRGCGGAERGHCGGVRDLASCRWLLDPCGGHVAAAGADLPAGAGGRPGAGGVRAGRAGRGSARALPAISA